MRSRHGRRLYLTSLKPPESPGGAREQRRQRRRSPAEAPQAWWATAEELIDRVGFDGADAMVAALIEYADAHPLDDRDDESDTEPEPKRPRRGRTPGSRRRLEA